MIDKDGITLACFVAFGRLVYVRFSFGGRFERNGAIDSWFGQSVTPLGAKCWWMPFFGIAIGKI